MSTSLPPVLVGNHITGSATHTVIDLEFSGTIERGSGSIIITDGALQTMIDRATGLPTLRVVGATQTYQVPLSQVGINGNHALVNADNLTAGHHYSVFIAPGVLASNGMPFAGVTNAAQLSFVAADDQPPTLAEMSLDNHQLTAAARSTLTLRFSEPVSFDPSALTVPNATVNGWGSSDGGQTWHATVTAQPGAAAPNNQLQLDMSAVRDTAGNHGSGTQSVSYSVDAKAPTASIALSGNAITPTGHVFATITFSEPVQPLPQGAVQAPHATVVNLHPLDGGITWSAELAPDGSATSSTGNVLTLDMSQVRDMVGNAGSGTSTAAAPYDVELPAPVALTASISLDQTQLLSGGHIIAAIRFSEPVANFSIEQISAPNATLDHLHTPDEGTTWYVEVEPQASGIYAGANALGFDLSKVISSAGHSGSGTAASGNYVVDTMVSSYVDPFIMLSDDTGYLRTDLVTTDASTAIAGYFNGALSQTARLQVSIDGVQVDPARLTITPDSNGTGVYAWHYAGAAPLAEGSHTVSAQIVDGEHASALISNSLTIDTAAPAMTSASPEGSTFDVAKSIVITFDQPVYWQTVFTPDPETAAPTVRQEDNRIKLADQLGGILWIPVSMANLSPDGRVLTISANELQLAAGKSYDLTLPAALTDLAGNQVSSHTVHFTTTGSFTDNVAPHALAAVVENTAGSYGIGQAVTIDVQFDEPVKLVGAAHPTLLLNNGATAVLSGLSADGRTASFTYKVDENDQQPTDNPQHWIDLGGTSSLAGAFTDLAGNVLTSDHIAFTHLKELTDQFSGSGIGIDTTVPVAPGVPMLDPGTDSGLSADDAITNVNPPVIHGSGAEPFAWIELYDMVSDSQVLVGSVSASATGTWTIDLKSALNGAPFNLSDGFHQLQAVQYDEAGNQSLPSDPLQLTMDTHAMSPVISPLVSGSDTGTVGDWLTAIKQPTLGGTAEAGAKIEVFDGAQLIDSTVADVHGAWAFAFKAGLGDGVHNLSIRQTDVAGNVSEPALQALTIDTTAQGALTGLTLDAGSDTGYLNNDGITKATKPLLTGAGAQANATIELYDGDKLVGSTTSHQDGSWSVAPTADLLDGVHAFCVRQVDAAGNAGPTSAGISVTIDTIAPTVSGWTNSVALGSNFEIWLSEPVVHSGLTNYADVSDNVTAALFHFALGNPGSWDDNVSRAGHPSSVWHFMPSNSGWVELELTGIQDLAGNVATIPRVHYEFTVPLTSILPPPVL
jgi:hypothetical protein